MNVRKEFYRIMATATELALATSIECLPNVRIVNFIFAEEKNIIFFMTFGDNRKVEEFEENNQVAFTTVPQNSNMHVRSRGVARKSELTILDINELFKEKIVGYGNTIDQASEFLVLYEISFTEAAVILDFENAEIFKLDK